MSLLPSEDEWDALGAAGDKAVRTALSRAGIRIARQGGHPTAPVALGFGAVKAVGDYFRAVTDPAGAHIVEQNAIAYLRGALRGADGPVHDNGKPFMGATNA